MHENKQHSTAEHAVDERTRLILHRFIDRGIISAVNGIISIGKEAVVVHADGGDVVTNDLEPINNENNRDITCSTIPKECAIKVYASLVISTSVVSKKKHKCILLKILRDCFVLSFFWICFR